MEYILITLLIISLLIIFLIYKNNKPKTNIKINTYNPSNLLYIYIIIYDNIIELYKLNRFPLANKSLSLIIDELTYLNNNKLLDNNIIELIKTKQDEIKTILIRLNAFKSNEKNLFDKINKIIE